MTSQLKTEKNRPNHWLDFIAQSRQINIQQEVESQQRFHLSLMDQRPGLSARVDRRHVGSYSA